MGIRGQILLWIRALINDRSFQVKVGVELSNVFILENGIPQGSVISPLLFAIMVNDLPHAIKSDHGMFADDCAFWESGASIPGLITSTQSTLNNICKWCLKWGFTISKTKSVAMLFTKKAKDMSTFPRNKWITPYIRPKIQIPWYHIRPKLVLQEPR